MKLLMIYADKFAYKTSVKNLESASDIDEQKVIENTLLGFIHVETVTTWASVSPVRPGFQY